jgi:hypothetical protein
MRLIELVETINQTNEGLLSKLGSRIKKAFTVNDAEYVSSVITATIQKVKFNLMSDDYHQGMHWTNLSNWAFSTNNNDIIDLVGQLELIFTHWPSSSLIGDTKPPVQLVKETLELLRLLQNKADQYFKN